jgi:AraC-like DNA-binding protein
MHWAVQAATESATDAPVSFVVAVYSIAGMLVVLGASTLTYLLRRRLERVESLLQGTGQNRYVKHIQGPAAAVIVASISGYGINIVTQNQGWLGYVGFLLAMPLPLAMVTWTGIRTVRQSDLERQWPPDCLLTSDRVRVRTALRRVQAESPHLEAAEIGPASIVLGMLLDQAVPTLRERRDRSLQRWLRDHRLVGSTVLTWILVTLTCVTVAALPSVQRGSWTGISALAGYALGVLLMAVTLLAVLWRYSRYRYDALAEEVAASAGHLRRQIAERRLGLRL